MATTRSFALSEALSRLINQQPFHACLLLDMLTLEENVAGIPTAATDGRRILINTEWFSKLTVDERVFVLAHEVMHVIMQHPVRGLNYHQRGVGPDLKEWNHRKWNQAADYIINDALVKDRVGRMPVGGLYHPEFTNEDLADEVYCKLPDPEDPPSGPGQGQDGEGGDGWDTHVHGDPTKAPTKAEIQRSVQGAATQAKAVGKMPGSMKRLVDELCEPQVPWADTIKLTLHAIAGKDAGTWARPNRRRLTIAPHVYLPGTESYQVGCIVVYEDTSGSISPSELKLFRSEMVGILTELNPQELYIGSCDYVAYDPVKVDDVTDIISHQAQGGGGTNMPAIFDKLEQEGIEPETLVILTDGYTPWGEAPPYPVVWVSTTDQKAPYGVTVRLKEVQ